MAIQELIEEQELGGLLRYWRQKRGKSQLDLSLDTGISQRHLSFIESGRSVPSRDLLSTVSEALGIPLRERNALLLASGYAPQYREPSFDAADMAIVSKAIDRVLQQHEPHPALVLDRYWNIIRANQATPKFFGSFIDLALWPRPRNLLRLIFDPTALRPHIENWEDVASGLLQRIRREALGHVIDQKTATLLNELNTYPGVTDLTAIPRSHGPILPITFIRESERISYFSLITTLGTPQSVTTQELRIECMFPADALE